MALLQTAHLSIPLNRSLLFIQIPLTDHLLCVKLYPKRDDSLALKELPASCGEEQDTDIKQQTSCSVVQNMCTMLHVPSLVQFFVEGKRIHKGFTYLILK